MRYGLALFLVLLASPALAYTSFTITPGAVDALHGAPLTYTVMCGTVKGGPYPLVSTVNAVAPPAVTVEPFAQEIPAGTPNGTYFCVAKATNATADSGFSPEITVPFTPPANPVLTVQ